MASSINGHTLRTRREVEVDDIDRMHAYKWALRFIIITSVVVGIVIGLAIGWAL